MTITELTPQQIEHALNKIRVSDREERIAKAIADALRTVADDFQRFHGQDRVRMTVLLTQYAPEVVIPKPEPECFDLEDFGVEVEQAARDRANELLNTEPTT